MPRIYRLDDLRLRCQRRSNKEGDPSISIPEWNALISEQYGDLYSEVEKTGLRYFESAFAFSANGAASYAVPVDHLATLGIDRITDSVGSRVTLDEMMSPERTRWAGQVGDAQSYAIVGQLIYLFPKPSSGNYEMLYMPQAPDLSTAADSTSVDVVQADGEAFLIWGVVVKALSKSESDVRTAMAEREAARVRFVDWAILRAFVQPRRPIYRLSRNEDDGSGGCGGVDDPGGWWSGNRS